ncbi:hypothetical protein HMPREF1982_02364 [Clostridiales bacterium oral taxon 876 str. F0540]|nr:hypothetical protein HMPREF1982_02364 [Clostridiales bacterium oral taxon 876 str. F0540]
MKFIKKLDYKNYVNLIGMEKKMGIGKDKIAIKELLEKFQKGYIERDLNNLDSFMSELFVNNDDVFIIGTAEDEIFIGYEQAKKLVEGDWRYWGDLRIDVDNAHINCGTDMTYITAFGTVELKIETDNSLKMALNDLDTVIKSEKQDKEKLMTICRKACTYLVEASRGEKHIWKIRLTIGLVKQNNKWLINNMHFSHPIGDYPGGRIIEAYQ